MYLSSASTRGMTPGIPREYGDFVGTLQNFPSPCSGGNMEKEC